MRNSTHGLCIVVVAAGLLGVWTCSPLEVDKGDIQLTDPLPIGLIVPVSVERTSEGTAYFATVLAAEEINNAGGVLNRDIEIVFRDDGGSPSKGVAEVRALHAQGIDIIIGSAWSSVTLAVTREVTISNGMLLISHSATSPQISTLNDNGLVWRTAPSDVFQGQIGADFVFNVFGKRTVGILHATNAYAADLAKSFGNAFEAFAGSDAILSFVSYPDEQNWATYDFTPHLEELFAGRPDAIYFVSFVGDASKLTNDIVTGNFVNDEYRPLFFSNDGPFGDEFLLNGHPTVLEGMRGTQPVGDENDPNFQRFKSNFEKRFGFTSIAFNEHAYDNVYLLAYAMIKAGSVSPQAIAAELQAVSGGDPGRQGAIVNVNEFAKGRAILEAGGDINYEGASGKIDFDVNGDPTSGTYAIWRVLNGAYVVESTVSFP